MEQTKTEGRKTRKHPYSANTKGNSLRFGAFSPTSSKKSITEKGGQKKTSEWNDHHLLFHGVDEDSRHFGARKLLGRQLAFRE